MLPWSSDIFWLVYHIVKKVNLALINDIKTVSSQGRHLLWEPPSPSTHSRVINRQLQARWEDECVTVALALAESVSACFCVPGKWFSSSHHSFTIAVFNLLHNALRYLECAFSPVWQCCPFSLLALADDLKPPPYSEFAQNDDTDTSQSITIPEGNNSSISDDPPPYTPTANQHTSIQCQAEPEGRSS